MMFMAFEKRSRLGCSCSVCESIRRRLYGESFFSPEKKKAVDIASDGVAFNKKRLDELGRVREHCA